jgi:hypothetical protein
MSSPYTAELLDRINARLRPQLNVPPEFSDNFAVKMLVGTLLMTKTSHFLFELLEMDPRLTQLKFHHDVKSVKTYNIRVQFPRFSKPTLSLSSLFLAFYQAERTVSETALLDDRTAKPTYICEWGYENVQQFTTYEEIVEELLRVDVLMSHLDETKYHALLDAQKNEMNVISKRLDEEEKKSTAEPSEEKKTTPN